VNSEGNLPPLITDRDVLAAYLARIRRHQDEFSAYVCDTEQLALHDLRRVEAARRAGQPLPLDGLPMVVKDNLDIAGYPTTAGSRAYGNAPADRDAVVVGWLRDAGALILAKSNLHELAYGGTNINPFFGTCRNPWNPGYISGGSSGGSAVAVALRDCGAALGTDTGGSGRIPAAFNGVIGLRPTYGAVSRRGLLLLSWSLDTVSVMALAASTARRVYAVMAQHDPGDPCAAFPPADFLRAEAGSSERLDGLRVLAVDYPPDTQPGPSPSPCVFFPNSAQKLPVDRCRAYQLSTTTAICCSRLRLSQLTKAYCGTGRTRSAKTLSAGSASAATSRPPS
jgi:aspartyl-tRNA(Asn)/glutamyl-tRNA(Gln) amidotransferase subunit A